MNNKIKQILIGSLLGDAHIGRSGNLSFITFEQSIKHEEYVKYIHNILSEGGLPLYDIKYYSRSDYRHNKINESVYFKSHNTELLNPLADMFIYNGEKIVPLNIKSLLSPVSIAHWICDDGQLVKNGGVTLCTDNYSKDQIKLLISAFKELYNIKCSIHTKKGKSGAIYYRIYIKKNDLDIIKPLIMKYIHTSFLYKIHE